MFFALLFFGSPLSTRDVAVEQGQSIRF